MTVEKFSVVPGLPNSMLFLVFLSCVLSLNDKEVEICVIVLVIVDSLDWQMTDELVYLNRLAWFSFCKRFGNLCD